MNLAVTGPRNRTLSNAMNGGPLRMAGTHDWTRVAGVLDVPMEAQRITFGVGVWGPGRLWIDSFTLRAVPDTVALTSDTAWHLATQFVSSYRLVSDGLQPRQGHATARLESIGNERKDVSAKLVRFQRTMDALRGKQVRIRAMIKAEKLSGGAGPFAAAGRYDEQGRYSEATSKPDLPVTGSTGWLRYTTTLAIPAQADSLEYGVRLTGTGTVWIDDIVVEPLP